jgi:hypothetical protein
MEQQVFSSTPIEEVELDLAFQIFLKQLTSDFSKTVASTIKEEQWTGTWDRKRVSEDWEEMGSMRDDLRNKKVSED